MRTLPLFLLVPAALLPLVAPHALEAVAQSPVGAGSSSGAANLATDAKMSSVKAETAALKQTVTELKTELKNVTNCASSGGVWNGTKCVNKKLRARLVKVQGAVETNPSANCNAGEIAVSAGGICGEVPNSLQNIYPSDNLNGWRVDCESTTNQPANDPSLHTPQALVVCLSLVDE